MVCSTTSSTASLPQRASRVDLSQWHREMNCPQGVSCPQPQLLAKGREKGKDLGMLPQALMICSAGTPRAAQGGCPTALFNLWHHAGCRISMGTLLGDPFEADTCANGGYLKNHEDTHTFFP